MISPDFPVLASSSLSGLPWILFFSDNSYRQVCALCLQRLHRVTGCLLLGQSPAPSGQRWRRDTQRKQEACKDCDSCAIWRHFRPDLSRLRRVKENRHGTTAATSKFFFLHFLGEVKHEVLRDILLLRIYTKEMIGDLNGVMCLLLFIMLIWMYNNKLNAPQ